jgi:hypothetical protein
VPDLDAEWLEALEVEDTGAPDTPADDDKPDDKPDDDAGKKDDEDDTAKKDDDKVPDPAEPPADDTAAKDDSGDDAEDKTPEEPDPSTATKDAVKEALREIEESKTDRSTKLDGFKKEVTKTLYPEGIDRQLRDSDGDPITGIDDLVKLINPKTGDYFTDEEAGSWLLGAQQKLNQEIQTVEKFVEEVAETAIQLEDGAARVVEKYEKVLTSNPQLKDRLLAAYNKTLVKDPNTGIALKAPVDVMEFFDLALEPMLTQQANEAEAAAKASKEAEAKAKKAKQAERGDMKFSGKAENLKPEDKEWAEAIKAYEEGAN